MYNAGLAECLCQKAPTKRSFQKGTKISGSPCLRLPMFCVTHIQHDATPSAERLDSPGVSAAAGRGRNPAAQIPTVHNAAVEDRLRPKSAPGSSAIPRTGTEGSVECCTTNSDFYGLRNVRRGFKPRAREQERKNYIHVQILFSFLEQQTLTTVFAT